MSVDANVLQRGDKNDPSPTLLEDSHRLVRPQRRQSSHELAVRYDPKTAGPDDPPPPLDDVDEIDVRGTVYGVEKENLTHLAVIKSNLNLAVARIGGSDEGSSKLNYFSQKAFGYYCWRLVELDGVAAPLQESMKEVGGPMYVDCNLLYNALANYGRKEEPGLLLSKEALRLSDVMDEQTFLGLLDLAVGIGLAEESAGELRKSYLDLKIKEGMFNVGFADARTKRFGYVWVRQGCAALNALGRRRLCNRSFNAQFMGRAQDVYDTPESLKKSGRLDDLQGSVEDLLDLESSDSEPEGSGSSKDLQQNKSSELEKRYGVTVFFPPRRPGRSLLIGPFISTRGHRIPDDGMFAPPRRFLMRCGDLYERTGYKFVGTNNPRPWFRVFSCSAELSASSLNLGQVLMVTRNGVVTSGTQVYLPTIPDLRWLPKIIIGIDGISIATTPRLPGGSAPMILHIHEGALNKRADEEHLPICGGVGYPGQATSAANPEASSTKSPILSFLVPTILWFDSAVHSTALAVGLQSGFALLANFHGKVYVILALASLAVVGFHGAYCSLWKKKGAPWFERLFGPAEVQSSKISDHPTKEHKSGEPWSLGRRLRTLMGAICGIAVLAIPSDLIQGSSNDINRWRLAQSAPVLVFSLLGIAGAPVLGVLLGTDSSADSLRKAVQFLPFLSSLSDALVVAVGGASGVTLAFGIVSLSVKLIVMSMFAIASQVESIEEALDAGPLGVPWARLRLRFLGARSDKIELLSFEGPIKVDLPALVQLRESLGVGVTTVDGMLILKSNSPPGAPVVDVEQGYSKLSVITGTTGGWYCGTSTAKLACQKVPIGDRDFPIL